MPNSTGARVDYCTDDPCFASGFYYDPGWTRFQRGLGREQWARAIKRREFFLCVHGVVLTGPPLEPGTLWAPFGGYCVPVKDGHTWPAHNGHVRVAGQEQRRCPVDRRLRQVALVPRVRRAPAGVATRRGPRLPGGRRLAAA